jgi:uncharacterized protein (DUF2141 family)
MQRPAAGALFSIVMLLPPLSAAWAFDLMIKVSGATPEIGQIIVSVFDSEEAYMKEPYREDIAPVDQTGMSSVLFDGLSAQDYAVSLIYDADADGELDTNIFGVPTEAFGFSNGAKAFFGPPGWKAAAFALNADLTIEIKLEIAD